MKQIFTDLIHFNRHARRPLKRIGMLIAMCMLLSVGVLSALSADVDLDRKEGGLQSYGVAASEQIYKGSLCVISATGYLEVLTDAASKRFVGVAYEKKLGTTDGVVKCRVYTSGVHKLTATSITQAMVGQMMYGTDDATIDDTTGGTYYIPVGRLVEYVSATSGWVDIGQRHLVGGADNVLLAPNGTKMLDVHTWGIVQSIGSLYMRSDYSAYVNSWMAGGLELVASTHVRMNVGGKGWNVTANGVCSTAYIIRTTGSLDFGASHTGRLQLPQRITSIAQPTEGQLWYDTDQDKLRFSTAAGMETVTSS